MINDLEFLQSLDADVIMRYIDLLAETDKQMVADRLTRWRAGKPCEQPAALALYCAELRRLAAHKPKREPKPLPSPEEVEKSAIERARKDVIFFIEYVSGKPPARHHKKWLANIFHPERKYINIIAPRGAGKTVILTWLMAYIMASDPILTNALISVSDTQATERILMLQSIFENNERFQNVFPDVEIDRNRPCNTAGFSIRYKESVMPYKLWATKLQREGNPKDPSLKVAGASGSGLVGSRWSGYVLVDDLVDDKTATADAQTKAIDFLMNVLVPCMVGDCHLGVVGTRWMVDDVAEKLQNNPEFTTIFFPSEMVINGVRKSYWPEWWTLELLDKRRALIGDKNYRTQYLCDPTATSVGLFTQEMVSRDLPSPLPPLRGIFITTDWAVSTKTRADFSCFEAVGVDYDDNYYILDMDHVKQGPETSPQTLGLFVDRVAAEWGHLAPITDVLIESVTFSVALKPLLENERPDLPCTPVVPKGDKDHRANLVSKKSENGKLFINQKMRYLNILQTEWVNFGTAAHDDTLDPMGLMIQHLALNEIKAKTHMVKFAHLL